MGVISREFFWNVLLLPGRFFQGGCQKFNDQPHRDSFGGFNARSFMTPKEIIFIEGCRKFYDPQGDSLRGSNVKSFMTPRKIPFGWIMSK